MRRFRAANLAVLVALSASLLAAILACSAEASPDRVRTVPLFVMASDDFSGFTWISTTDTRLIQACFASEYPVPPVVRCLARSGALERGPMGEIEMLEWIDVEWTKLPD